MIGPHIQKGSYGAPRTAFCSLLQIFPQGVKKHHRRGLGQLAYGDGSHGGCAQKKVLVEDPPVKEVAQGGMDDGYADQKVGGKEDGVFNPRKRRAAYPFTPDETR
jgi:hypothetical protein